MELRGSVAALAAQPDDAVACKGIPRKGCNYLAYADTVCNKCGEVHHHHQMLAHFYAAQPAPAAVPLTGEQIDAISMGLFGCINAAYRKQITDSMIAAAGEKT